MNINIFKRKSVKVLFMAVLMSTCFAAFSGITAFAAVDLDVTIVPPDDTVTNGSDCEVDLEILTKSDNGYKEMLINIEYDEDLLRLAAPVNQNGYRVVGSKGKLTLNYTDPTGTNTPTPIGNKEVIPIHFIVLDDAPDATTKIKANIAYAYNKKGLNIIWTPIYDKSIEIIRINQDVANDTTSSEEESSQFVVGDGTNLINRSGDGTVAGNAGKVASVIIGAIVIFSAGMAAGNIFCMKRYGLSPRSSKKENEDGYYDRRDQNDDYDESEVRRGSSGRGKTDSYDDEYYDDYGDNDEGFYSKPGEDYTVDGDDDYLTVVPVSKNGGDSYPDLFGSASTVGTRSLDPSEFSSIFDRTKPTESASKKQSTFSDDDDYPALFASSRKTEARQAPVAPTFSNDEDTIFGRFSANVERNVDDGYGGISSSRSRDRSSERSPRNR